MNCIKLSFALGLAAFANFAVAQDKPAVVDKPAAEKSETLDFMDGKLTMTKPASWKSVPPKSTMTQYEFKAPAEGEKSSRVTMMVAGGSVQSNIDRWIGQFDGAKKEDAKVEKKEVDKTTVHIVDITGTFKESMGGPFAPGPAKKMENYRMLGAILEVKGAGTLFIKITGPKETVAELQAGFNEMLTTLKNK